MLYTIQLPVCIVYTGCGRVFVNDDVMMMYLVGAS